MSCFAERGYCVLGDLCQFDHGNDPLVVDEVSLPSMIPFPPPGLPPPPGLLLPPLPGPVRGLRLPVPQPHPQPPPPVVLPVPRESPPQLGSSASSCCSKQCPESSERPAGKPGCC